MSTSDLDHIGPDGAAPTPAASPERLQPAERSDEQLLEHVAAGDRQAFADLYDRFAPQVLGLVLRVVRDREASEEITRQVFGEAWDTAADFDAADATVATWLLTTTHRRAVDHLRDDPLSARDQYIDLGAPTSSAAAAATSASAPGACARRALAKLPALQRGIVELTYFGGDTCREAANLLGTPLETVKTQLRAGLRSLHDDLEACA